MPGPPFGIFLPIALATLAAAIKFAMRPAERTLTVLRPMCAATTFATLAAFFMGMANGLIGLSHWLGRTADAAAAFPLWRTITSGLAEALMVLVLGSALLTASWLLVAVGLRRQA